MQIAPFAVEEWMNRSETKAACNIAETCVDSVSLDELLDLCGEPLGCDGEGARRTDGARSDNGYFGRFSFHTFPSFLKKFPINPI